MAKNKYYHLYGQATASDGSKHIVTVVGELEQKRKPFVVKEKVPVEYKPGCFVDGELTYTIKRLRRRLTIGSSICHPLDKFDEDTGVRIAKRKIKEGRDMGIIETSDVTMLTKDAIMTELFTKLQHIIHNIDEYIS